MNLFQRLAIILIALGLFIPQAHAKRFHQNVITCNHQGCSDRPFYQQNAYGYGASKTRSHARSVTFQGGVTITITKRHPGASAAAYDGNYNTAERIIPHPAGCPRIAYCGCGASVEVFGHPVRELFLAANWGKFPPAAPAPGMVAWRHGHAFVIKSVNSDGTVVAIDHNSGGHLSRVHTVSLHGMHVVNPNAEFQRVAYHRHSRIAWQ